MKCLQSRSIMGQQLHLMSFKFKNCMNINVAVSQRKGFIETHMTKMNKQELILLINKKTPPPQTCKRNKNRPQNEHNRGYLYTE